MNTDFEQIYGGCGGYTVDPDFGVDHAKAIEECIEKKQEEYEAAMEAREDALIEAVLNGESYDDFFNIDSEQPVFEATDGEKVIELVGSGVENVKIENDITTQAFINVKNDVVLDLNGKELTRDMTGITGNAPIIYVSGGTLTLVGDGAVVSDGDASSASSISLWVSNKDAKVVIKSGKFYGSAWADESKSIDTCPCIYSSGGLIEIHGGEFRGAWGRDIGQTLNPETGVLERGSYNVLNCLDANYKAGEADIKVYGGKFFNFNPIACTSEGPDTNFVVDGYTVKVNGVEDLEPWNPSKGDVWYQVVKK